MLVISSIEKLPGALSALSTGQKGCLADTSFLYALAYDDDRLHEKAAATHDWLAENEICIFANVISRMEFIDLIFRKQVTLGAIELFSSIRVDTQHKDLFNLLKSIRDSNTAAKRDGLSYKVGESQLKKLRRLLNDSGGLTNWKSFCETYVGNFLTNEWKLLEEELGLNFIEILEGGTSEIFHHPLTWTDMVEIMSKQGLRAPDAMILNFFSRSNLNLLITGDSDFELSVTDQLNIRTDKTVLIL